jgi:hypothetical protein
VIVNTVCAVGGSDVTVNVPVFDPFATKTDAGTLTKFTFPPVTFSETDVIAGAA